MEGSSPLIQKAQKRKKREREFHLWLLRKKEGKKKKSTLPPKLVIRLTNRLQIVLAHEYLIPCLNQLQNLGLGEVICPLQENFQKTTTAASPKPPPPFSPVHVPWTWSLGGNSARPVPSESRVHNSSHRTRSTRNEHQFWAKKTKKEEKKRCHLESQQLCISISTSKSVSQGPQGQRRAGFKKE